MGILPFSCFIRNNGYENTPIDLQKITFLRTSIWTAKKQHQFQTKLKSLPPPGPRTTSVPECTALEQSPSRALGANSLASSDLAPNRVFQSRSKELRTVQWYIPGNRYHLSHSLTQTKKRLQVLALARDSRRGNKESWETPSSPSFFSPLQRGTPFPRDCLTFMLLLE